MPSHPAAGALCACLALHCCVSTKGGNLVQSCRYLTSLTILSVICLLSQFILLYQHTTFLNNFKLRRTLKLMSLTTLLVVKIMAMAQKRDGKKFLWLQVQQPLLVAVYVYPK